MATDKPAAAPAARAAHTGPAESPRYMNVPGVASATQNRAFDPTGRTVDVVYTEDVEQASAEGATYAFSGGVNVMGMPSLVGSNTVRVTTDAVVVPGDVTVDVSGTTDLAGNPMVAANTLAIATTDTLAPSATTLAASAREGSGCTSRRSGSPRW